jgi:1,2-diacylglycerol 3-beta-galactosyltransferase
MERNAQNNRPSFEHLHMVFLFSDTGGGHRSAAEAIIEALHLEYGERVSTDMVDIFKQYAPRPINRAPEWYPTMVRIPELWGLTWHLSNGPRRTKFILTTLWPYVRSATKALVTRHPGDIIVSVHPLAIAPVLHAYKSERPPFVTVVTDLVTMHAFWFSPDVDLTVVPTEEARRAALIFGLRPEKVQVVGLPVADRFCRLPTDRQRLRSQLGWPQDLPVVLLVGGGEGMGPLGQTARAIVASGMPLTLVIVTGRNRKLKARLEAQEWPVPTFVYGFVREMPLFMQAADILVTKAGPGTITEALNASLPVILYSRLPGQEDGNVVYVTTNGAGVWAPRPELVTHAIQEWLKYPKRHAQAVAACQRLANPQAARQIARILVRQALSKELVGNPLKLAISSR